jgi:hypothetical protein
MKIITSLLIFALLFALGCSKKQPQSEMDKMMMKGNPHQGMDMKNPHAGMDTKGMQGMEGMGGDIAESGGLDMDALLAKLPDGWTKGTPSSTMRLAQISVAPVSGDKEPGEIAVFHFPGSGGSSAMNIERWQNQMAGPKGEPGPSVAKTDTMMVGLMTVITTDITGVLLGSSAMTGEAQDKTNMRMIASVVETSAGNWFFKAVGPVKTMTANAGKIRDFLKRAKMKDSGGHS